MNTAFRPERETAGNMLAGIVALSQEAGRAIMEIYGRADIGQTSKADDSPLTAADMASHHAIVKGLETLTPDIPVLSEEAAGIEWEKRRQWPRYWLVDPLDGTKEFIKRNGEFTVNIALVEGGRPMMGVVHAPVLDVTYAAAAGQGATVQRDKSQPVPIHAIPHRQGEPLRVVASRSHSDARTQALLERLGPHECISMGSSLKLCLVAEGKAHLYPRLGPTMEWDTAAAHAVVKEAGGTVRDPSGYELQYNKPDLHNPEFYVYAATDNVLPRLLGGDNG